MNRFDAGSPDTGAQEQTVVRRHRIARRTLRILGYTLAVLGLPAVVGFVGVGGVMEHIHSQPEPFPAEVEAPRHDPDKPTAVVLLSNVWTEMTDVLGPYQVLAASGEFNVYTVAPERRLVSLNGVVDLLPHHSLDGFEALGHPADVVVVPYVADIEGEANEPLLAWIAAQADRGADILSICAGAEVVAASGVLEGRRATTIWMEVDRLERAYPGTDWVRGARYVDDGAVVSSAGVTSGIDATLYYLQRFGGEALAREVADAIRYPHVRFLDDPRQPADYGTWSLAPIALHGAFQWDRPTLGMALHDGVGELELSSVVEMNAFTTRAVTVADERRPIETAHGLHVVPRYAAADAPRLDRLVVPGDPATAIVPPVSGQQNLRAETPHADAARRAYPFDAIVMDVAQRENAAISRATAASLEYPTTHLSLPGRAWPYGMALRPLLLGLLAAALLYAGERLLRPRRARRAPEGAS